MIGLEIKESFSVIVNHAKCISFDDLYHRKEEGRTKFAVVF